ncbi:MAG TPA: sterol desaturase family protein [Ideonella sp.]|nr:sterol desaturase family protein [Ideonella sp.]
MEHLAQLFGDAQSWLFQAVVQPLVFAAGGGSLLEDAFDATGWLLVGLLQLAVMLAVFGPLQRLWPAEALPTTEPARAERRRAVWEDVVYTLIHRLGLFRLALFFTIDPLWDALFGQLALAGVGAFHLDQALAPLWPGVSDTALFGFVAYLVVFDFADYLLHRAQHHFSWWWALHALHHSQRHMTLWSDNRNHLLDDLVRDSLFVLLARAIGVAPAQFILLVALSQLVESLAHANLRWSFGWLGERLLVGPRFHRLHHAIGVGHESAGKGTLGGHNFAVLFPLWDLLFRTARFGSEIEPTGIRDQLPQEGGRDYGRGFWRQQWLGLRRLAGRS